MITKDSYVVSLGISKNLLFVLGNFSDAIVKISHINEKANILFVH